MTEEQGLVKVEKQSLAELQDLTKQMGLDPNAEIEKLTASQPAHPFLKIEHDEKEGLHGFYIQLQEGIFDDTGIIRLGTRDEPVDEIELQFLMFEPIRSYFPDPTKKMPECASAKGEVLKFIKESMNSGLPTCEGCSLNDFGTDCKPRIRCMVGFKTSFEDNEPVIYPFLFHIPPASLTTWNKFTKKLQASKVPIQSIAISLKLEDVNEAFRFARIQFSVKDSINQEQFEFAKESIAKFRQMFETSKDTEFATHAGEDQPESSPDDDEEEDIKL